MKARAVANLVLRVNVKFKEVGSKDTGKHCKILHKFWSVLWCDTLDFYLPKTFLGSNMAALLFDPRKSVEKAKIMCVTSQNTLWFMKYFASCPKVFCSHHFEFHKDPRDEVKVWLGCHYALSQKLHQTTLKTNLLLHV